MTQPLDPTRASPPLDLTPEQLDLAAEVTTVDIAGARALWNRAAGSRFIDLLDAAPQEEPL